MVELESNSIDASQSYEEFNEFQESTASTLSGEDCLRIKGLLELLKAGRLNNMDMETCVSFSSVILFFDKNKELVIANDR